jgi:hypothetical protein
MLFIAVAIALALVLSDFLDLSKRSEKKQGLSLPHSK